MYGRRWGRAHAVQGTLTISVLVGLVGFLVAMEHWVTVPPEASLVRSDLPTERIGQAMQFRVEWLKAPNAEHRLRAIRALAGPSPSTPRSFTGTFFPFSGEWRGFWRSVRMEHQWERPELAVPPVKVGSLLVSGWQKAWVGDGWGWNVEAIEDGRTVLLGAVHHLNPKFPEHAYWVPHFGFALGDGHVAWVTPDRVFLERVHNGRYTVQSYRWSDDGGKPTLIPAGETIYRRPTDPELSDCSWV